MVKTVIKRDGTRVPFDIDKIRKAVLAAAGDAGLTEDNAQSAASKVVSTVLQYTSNQDEIFTDELRNLILGELDELAPRVSELWREYDQKNKGISGDVL
jgi:transcriptional regulator NrdR family protein